MTANQPEVATRLLQREGAEVITAIDGERALADPARRIDRCSWMCRCR